uniref:Probable G-protein coupled receptor 33 n=1 Tax=Leptobrachium leishanense TaxID=445787 RepID=A0A8C5QDN3_9ANUR
MTWNLTSSTQPLNSTTGSGTTISNPVAASKVVIALILLITFMFGVVVSTPYLWVLGFRMKKTVNTTWFFHLILAHLAFTFVLPFVIIQLFVSSHWMFDLVICKLINSLCAVSMYGAIFFLTVISLDRYMSVFSPHWYRMHMNPHYATIICLILWGSAILFSTPYLIFQPHPKVNSSAVCDTGYTLPLNWGSQLSQYQVKWGLFTFRVLLGYILPFVIISFCYFRIAIKMKTGKLARSSKPYKIICVKIVSFFVCLLPYYILFGLVIQGDFTQRTMNVMWMLTACFGCFYVCFTPIFYLLSVVHSFKAFCGNSVLSLMESVFKELSQ